MDSRRWRLALLGILGLALLLRVVYVLQSQASPAFQRPTMDALYHLQWARAVAEGRDFQPGPFFRAPLYPWFLGVLLKATGGSLLAARLVQALLGTVSVLLVALVAKRAFDARTALLAALFAATYWVTIYFEGEFLLPVLEILLDLAAILLALRMDERRTPGSAAWAGIAFGLATIVRPNVLLFVPFVALWIFLRARPSDRADGEVRGDTAPARLELSRPVTSAPSSRLALPLLFLVGLALPIAPITAYNRVVGKDWVLVSSQGGVNFWIGNHPGADGATAIVPGTRGDWWGGYRDAIRLAEIEEGRPLAPSEVSRHYAQKAWRWIFAAPRDAAILELRKLRLFFTDWEIPNNTSERFFAMRYGPVLRVLPYGFGLLAPLGLLGFALAARSWRRLFPLWAFLPVYTASVVAFFVCARYRVPVVPVLAILAAHGAVGLFDFARARRWIPLAASGAFLAATIALVANVPSYVDRSDSQAYWELGVDDVARGDLESAVGNFRESIRRKPNVSVVHQDLGDALAKHGDEPEAEAELRQALALDRSNAVAAQILVEFLTDRGRLDEAEPLARSAIERSPVSASLRYALGRLLYARGAEQRERGDPERARTTFDAALAELRRGLDLATDPPTTFRCAFAAGRILKETGRASEAVPAFERALAAVPDPPGPADAALDAWWWQCQADLVASLDASDRATDARARRDDLLRRFPSDARAKQLGARGGN